MSKLAHSNQETMDQIEARELHDSGDLANIDAEANQFAMELLMPADFVKTEIAKMKNFDIEDDKALKKLADKFRVSPQIMAIRIGQLSNRF